MYSLFYKKIINDMDAKMSIDFDINGDCIDGYITIVFVGKKYGAALKMTGSFNSTTNGVVFETEERNVKDLFSIKVSGNGKIDGENYVNNKFEFATTKLFLG